MGVTLNVLSFLPHERFDALDTDGLQFSEVGALLPLERTDVNPLLTYEISCFLGNVAVQSSYASNHGVFWDACLLSCHS